ncbi:MAG: hypothetical protein ABH873_09465 [Candidatus Firestonebacteria bacterium]
MFRRIVIVFVSMFLVSLGYSEEVTKTDDTQKKIVKYMEEVQEYNTKQIKDFSAKLIQSTMGGEPLTSMYFQKNNPDGSMCMRTESKIFDKKIIVILNSKGMWSIDGDKAYKIEYMDNMKKDAGQEIFKSIKPEDIEQGEKTFSREESKYKDIPCYLVSVKTVLSEEAKKLKKEMIDKFMPKDMKALLKNINMNDVMPFVTESYIGKEDKFIYRTVSYNEKEKSYQKHLMKM